MAYSSRTAVTRTKPGRSGLRQAVWRTALVAAALGMVGGLVETLLFPPAWHHVSPRYHLLGTAVYGQFFLIAGAVLGLVGGLILRRRDPSGRALPIALGSGLAVFVMVTATTNKVLLPSKTSPVSLVTDLLLLLGSLALALWLFRRLRPADPDQPFAARWILTGLAALVAATVLALVSAEDGRQAVARADPRPDLPNILFILADTLRADHLGVYGYPHPTSPWLDELAARGVVFENVVSASSHTKPSTASIFTSRYPPAHGVRRIEDALPAGSATFVTGLQAAGYRTAAFSANTFVSESFGFGPGFDRFDDRTVYFSSLHLPHTLIWARARVRAHLGRLHLPIRAMIARLFVWEKVVFGESSVLHSAEDLSERAVEWIDEDDDAPFFVYLHLLEPHAPYSPPKGLLREFETLHGGRADSANHPHYVRGFVPFRPAPEIDEPERKGLLARYDAEIAALDAVLRKLEAAVRGLSKDRPLLIVFTSDHGEEFFDHRGWGHAHSLFGEVLHVPLILSGLPSLPAGRRIDQQVSLIDLAPTLLELLDLPSVEPFQGISVRGLLQLEGSSEESPAEIVRTSPAFSELLIGGGRHWARSLSSDCYKLIHLASEGREAVYLFDQSDTDERVNLADRMPDELRRLDQKMQALLEHSRALAPAGEQIELNDDQLKQLRALGYVE